MPLYLDFVQVLACGYATNSGFAWVRHDPIVDQRRAPIAGEAIGGVVMENTPLKPLVDELALAVLAHQRSGRELPEALRVFADLFGPGGGSEPPAGLSSSRACCAPGESFSPPQWAYCCSLAQGSERPVTAPSAGSSEVDLICVRNHRRRRVQQS